MGALSVARTGVVEWAAAVAVSPGETECGDQHVVMPSSRGVLIAVVDGAGHGREAAAVAKCAIATIGNHGSRDSLSALLERCHAALRGTRGAVMSLAMFNAAERTMTWLGVGNVEGRLLRKTQMTTRRHENLLLRPGLLGEQLPPLQSLVVPMGRGDMLIFATDGVAPGFADGVETTGKPQQIAEDIVAQRRDGPDDALVLVARFVG